MLQRFPASSSPLLLLSSGGVTGRTLFLPLGLLGGGLSSMSRVVDGPGTGSTADDPEGILFIINQNPTALKSNFTNKIYLTGLKGMNA